MGGKPGQRKGEQMSVDQEQRSARSAQPGPVTPVPDEPFYRRGEQARRWGALLLLVGVVWLVFALAGRGSLLPLGFVERTESIATQSYSAERVVISGLGDDVEFVAADGDEIVVDGLRRGFGWNEAAAQDSLRQLELLVEESGDTLRIELRRPSFAAVGRAPTAELRVALPAGVAAEAELVSGELRAEGVRGDLQLRTVSGSVSASDTAGRLDVPTTSGDVELSDHSGPLAIETTSGEVQADGELADPRVTTVSGDVELDGTVGELEARSISGALSVTDARDARLRIESTSGDVEFAGALAAGASEISNISGDVRVRLDEPDDLRLDLRSTSGDLESDLPLRDVERERRSLRGSVGDGGSTLAISTTSGDIEVTGE
jgi:hypothetical protein